MPEKTESKHCQTILQKVEAAEIQRIYDTNLETALCLAVQEKIERENPEFYKKA